MREQRGVGVEEAERTSAEPWTHAFCSGDGVASHIRVGRTSAILAGEVSNPEGRLQEETRDRCWARHKAAYQWCTAQPDPGYGA